MREEAKEEGIGEGDNRFKELAPAAGGTGKSWVSRARLPGQRFGWEWLLQPESEFHKASGWRASGVSVMLSLQENFAPGSLSLCS